MREGPEVDCPGQFELVLRASVWPNGNYAVLCMDTHQLARLETSRFEPFSRQFKYWQNLRGPVTNRSAYLVAGLYFTHMIGHVKNPEQVHQAAHGLHFPGLPTSQPLQSAA